MTDWSPATLWWLVTGGLVAAELLTGTFYLLMLALGAAAGALAAHAGLGASAQVLAAAVAGGGAVAAWHAWRQRGRLTRPAEDVNQHLDIGCTVQVAAWSPDGRARVQHRGSDWDAVHDGPADARPGPHVIRAVQGNRLVLAPPADPARPT